MYAYVGMHTCYYIYMYSLPTLYAHCLAVHTPLHICVYEHTACLHIRMYNLHTLHTHYKQYVHSLHTVCTVPCRYTLPTHCTHTVHTLTLHSLFMHFTSSTHTPHTYVVHTLLRTFPIFTNHLYFLTHLI